MNHRLLQVIADKYENQIETSVANIKVFLQNPTGVAEHIDYTDTIEKELEKISHAQDMIDALDVVRFRDEKLYSAYDDDIENPQVDYDVK
jgi:hypothetical protein